jgi:hypothetical protein
MRDKITGALILISCCLACFFFGGYMFGHKASEIRIIEKTKTEYKYIKTAQTCDDYKKAYESPIEIDGQVNKDWLNVIASDGYKESKKGFKIGAKQNWNFVLCAGMVGIIAGGVTIWAIKK